MGERSLVLQVLGRLALLLLWSLVGWGTLLLVSGLVNAIGEGPAAALARLLPTPGASIWAWLSSLSVLLALAAGLLVGALVIARRWPDGASPDQ
jgi:hypothetical protein